MTTHTPPISIGGIFLPNHNPMKEKLNALLSNPKVLALLSRLKVTLQGEFPRGEKLGGHSERTIQANPKPSWNEWCEEFGVASRVNPNKKVYYEI